MSEAPSAPTKPTSDQIAHGTFIQVVTRQREEALTAVAQVASQNAVLASQVQDLQAEVAALKAENEKLKPAEPAPAAT